MKLRIIAAPDKFKGSMTADAAARAVIRGAKKAAGGRGIELSCSAVHIADGGEGTLEALVPPEKIKMFTVTGPDGATYVYSPQKGAGTSLLPVMEAGMKNYAEIIKRMTGTDVSGMPGCGAGGGLPAPLVAFFGAKIMTGIDAVLEAADFDDLLRSADLVITGEGKLDSQSLFGKAVSGVAAAAARRGVPAVCIAGVSGLDEEGIRRIGLRKLYTLASEAPDPGYSMSHAEELTELLAARAVEEFLSDREV